MRPFGYPCPECKGRLELRHERPDPHEPPVPRMVCDGCDYTEEPPVDIEADSEDRPRLPGF